MANVLLVGTEDIEWDSGSAGGRFRMSRFQAIKSGTAKTLKHYTGLGQGNCKLAIYADSSGSPGALLASTGEISANAFDTWFEASISDVSIVAGQYYWLAWITDYAAIVALHLSTGTNKSRSETYSTFSYPNPAGSLDAYDNQGIVACMGAEGGAGSIIPILAQDRRRRVA